LAVKKKTTKRKVTTKRKAAPKTKAAPKRKVTTKRKAAPKKKSTKSKPKKAAFGGYAISFAGRKETAEQIFGKTPIAPSEMTKKIWAFVKSKNLSNR